MIHKLKYVKRLSSKKLHNHKKKSINSISLQNLQLNRMINYSVTPLINSLLLLLKNKEKRSLDVISLKKLLNQLCIFQKNLLINKNAILLKKLFNLHPMIVLKKKYNPKNLPVILSRKQQMNNRRMKFSLRRRKLRKQFVISLKNQLLNHLLNALLRNRKQRKQFMISLKNQQNLVSALWKMK